MDFQQFEKQVAKIAKIELPGATAHTIMAPLERLQYLLQLKIDKKTVKKAAVMVLFYPTIKGDTSLVLIHRKTYKGVHSNQVGFPGGKWEPQDASLKHTALRETEEEIGVPANAIKVLCPLSKLYIPPSNFYVYPFFGLLPYPPTFKRQPEEVESIIEFKLLNFLDQSIISKEKVVTSYANTLVVPVYKINGFTVWGATAMMLSEVRELLKQLL